MTKRSRSSEYKDLDAGIATLAGTELIAFQDPTTGVEYVTTVTKIVGTSGGGTAVHNPVLITEGGTGQTTAAAGLAALGGAGTATVTNRLTRTAVKTAATYTAAAGDLVPVDTTSNNVTVTLPTAPATGTIIEVRHIIRGGTNTVSIVTGGTDVFSRTGGPTTATLTLAGHTLLVQYDSGSGTWTPIGPDLPLAQLDLRYLSLGLTTVADANYTILATDKVVLYSSISAARTATLPAASAVQPGQPIFIGDESGSVTTTNSITVARAGSDTINGATSATITTAYGLREFFSDGVSKWTVRTTGLTAGGTGATTAAGAVANLVLPGNDQTGTSYTLVLADANSLVTLSNAAAIALTIPANASVAFPVWTQIQILQKGAGQVTVGITSDTLNGTPGLKTRAQYSMATLTKTSATTWVIAGDLSA